MTDATLLFKTITLEQVDLTQTGDVYGYLRGKFAPWFEDLKAQGFVFDPRGVVYQTHTRPDGLIDVTAEMYVAPSADPQPEPIDETEALLADLREILKMTSDVQREIEKEAKERGIPATMLRTRDGGFSLEKLLLARSNAIHSIILLTDRRPKPETAQALYQNALETMASYRQPEKGNDNG